MRSCLLMPVLNVKRMPVKECEKYSTCLSGNSKMVCYGFIPLVSLNLLGTVKGSVMVVLPNLLGTVKWSVWVYSPSLY